MKVSRTTTLEVSQSRNLLIEVIVAGISLLGVLLLSGISIGQELDTPEQESPTEDSSIDFDRDILPLLSDRCFQCHGPDEAARESGLRLDTQEGAFGAGDSGEPAIVAGDSSASTLYHRIFSSDADLLMPPPESGLQLLPDEREKLKAWIDQGANWKQHWAFVTPSKPTVPAAPEGFNASLPIDRFILRQVVQSNLAPNPPADKETLIRRVTLDLTGLPPTISEIDDFLADQSPEAYEKVIDRLLKSPRYGEHMGRIWLDAARYADTHGLHLDNERQIWPYRDWVIQAFNQNMPFDQFTIEQIAGDLLPTPTLPQRVATGFNRCNVTTSEGGSIDDEYYVRYAVDRVETTSTVWLGLTAGCAACHDHKFDPLTQKEFYQLFSYFYSLTEKAMDGNALLPPPVVKVPTQEQSEEQARLAQLVSDTTNTLQTQVDAFEYVDPTPTPTDLTFDRADSVWFDDALPDGAKPQGDGPNPWQFVQAPEHPVYSGDKSTFRSGAGLNQHFFTDASSPLVIGENDSLFAYVYLDPENPPETVQLQFNNGNWEHRAFWGADKGHGAGRNNPSNLRMGDLPEPGKWVRLEVPATSVDLQPGTKLNGWAFTQFGGTVHWDQAGAVTVAPLTDEQLASQAIWEKYQKEFNKSAISDELKKIINLERSERSEEQVKKLREHYLKQVNPKSKNELSGLITQLNEFQKQLDAVNQSIPSTLVMEERSEPRQAYILERGEYTEQRDPVSPATPQWLGPQPKESANNRLGLAHWLVSPENPLTSRVIVNRFWQHFFGTGIVKTSEDFGVQGERPSHPELLDWLALEFIESGWDLQHLQKRILLSATYQQQSTVSESHLRVDPENRLLARGPRFRLDAEIIRDQALFVSGLMHNVIGGPSVKPYQPAGLWKPVGFGGSNTSVFTQDTGEKLYRRSMYTFWKRTSPPPSMTTFDAPDRETCQVRRARTNTPLQALVLLNDVQFIEAARKFAEKVHREGGDTEIERLTFAFRSTVGRKPSETEIARLQNHLAEYLQHFQASPEAASQLLSVGESTSDDELEVKSVAAWTLISHLLLNLSETITRG